MLALIKGHTQVRPTIHFIMIAVILKVIMWKGPGY
jgi:hypothetical protein